MKSIKLSNYLDVIKPEYIYLKLRPNNSIRNNNTHKLARTISSLYKNVFESIKKEEVKLIKILGKDFMFGTKYSIQASGKVSYYIYIEKKKIEFYFIIPKHHLSVIKEKISDVWSNITVEEVDEIPTFSVDATKYQLVYSKEDALSLAADRRNNELLQSNLNVVDILEEEDSVGIFYNFTPTSQFSWRSEYKNTIDKIKKKAPVDRNKAGLGYLLKSSLGIVSSLVDSVLEAFLDNKTKKKENILEGIIGRLNEGNQYNEFTKKKANASVLDTQILVLSESSDPLRKRNNAKSLAQSFDTISDDNRLEYKPYRKNIQFTDYKIQGAAVNKVGDEESQNFLSIAGRELLEQHNFIDKVVTQETQVPEDLRKGVMRLGENIYRGMKQPAFLTNDKEFRYLSLILIGPNRAGKSTLIGNMGKDAIDNNECVINFDFIGNCELSDEISELFTQEKTLNIECDDFKTMQGLGYNEIPNSDDPFERYANAKKQTTQLMTLINSINTDDTSLSSRMERFLQAAANIVFISGGSITDVFEVLQDHEARMEYIEGIPESQNENLEEYMKSLKELNEYTDQKTKVKNGNTTKTVTTTKITGTKYHLISGIIDRLNKLKANPYMELMLKKDTAKNINLVDEFQKSQLINIRMPENMFGTDNEKDVYTTYWITKIWLTLQVRKVKFKGNRDKMKKVNLLIDELYQVENTEKFITTKLSRLPKFNIKPIISCHYLNQIKHIREELRSANASYMLIAGCDKDNFKELKSELYPFQEEDLLNLKRFDSMNYIKNKEGYGRFITKLPPPVGEKTK